MKKIYDLLEYCKTYETIVSDFIRYQYKVYWSSNVDPIENLMVKDYSSASHLKLGPFDTNDFTISFKVQLIFDNGIVIIRNLLNEIELDNYVTLNVKELYEKEIAATEVPF